MVASQCQAGIHRGDYCRTIGWPTVRNLVLLCLDSVRKDYFDEFAPRLRARADVEYEQCRAASGWSIPSHASLFTGELPHVHGVHSHSRDFEPLVQRGTFIDGLAGHRTIGISTNPYLATDYRFDTLFDEFAEILPGNRFRFHDALSPADLDLSNVGPFDYLKRAVQDSRPLQSLANGALYKFNLYEFLFSGRPWPELVDKGTKEALATGRSLVQDCEDSDTPVFAFINLMDAHLPMYHHIGLDRTLHGVPYAWTSSDGPTSHDVSQDPDTHRTFLQRYTALYRASIDYLDRLVAAWIDEIRRTTEHPTTVVITADHGENLGTAGDDYLFDHHASLTEAILHVPLVVVNPPHSFDPCGERIVSHLEVGELNRSLVSDRPFEFGDDLVIAEVIGHTGEHPGGAYWDRSIRAVYDDSIKTVWDSLGRASEYLLDLDEPSTQTLRRSWTDDVPAYDSTLFRAEILEAKRDALEMETTPSADTDAGPDLSTLRHLGYL